MNTLRLLRMALFLATGTASADAPGVDRLPAGCSVVASDVIPGPQRDAIGRRLGVQIQALSNTRLVLHGASLQVNILEAGSADDAARLQSAIAGTKSDAVFCRRVDRTVFEFCKGEADTAIKAAYEMGIVAKPQRVTYRVTARVATVRTADYMAFNDLCRVFFASDSDRPDPAAAERVAALVKGFTFGDRLVMRAPQSAGAVFRFTPTPVRSETQGNDRVVFTFADPPKALGVPYVTLHAEIPCDRSGLTPTARAPDAALLAASAHWPVDDPEVAALARSITEGRTATDAKVRAILEWLAPNLNIKSDGPSGSRWGVKKVLQQKFGHCWDSSDLFVTLARAAGVPCRQVGGWLFGTGGHIWAEVLVPGKGWQQVDPTGGGRLECGIYHVAYFVTEDGGMPILYASLPKLEIVESP